MPPMILQELAQEAADLAGLALKPEQVDRLEIYARLLLDWNQRINLTAIRSPEEVRIKHFLDSLSCVLAFGGAPQGSLVDVGTGAGFPGLALKIVFPKLRLALVESVGKKLAFCAEVVSELGLEQVSLVNARAEDAGRMPEHREQYDWVLARAVAEMPVLAEYLLPFVRVGGWMVAQKGESGPQELARAKRAITLLGGRAEQSIPIQLPGIVGERWLIRVKKIAPCPAAYPRRAGLPAQKPL